ncbi:MAG: tetratricopeptide repeat protein [Caldimonas sp.]
MRYLSFLLPLVALVSACAVAPPPVVVERADPLLADRLFGAPGETITTDDVFGVSDEMKRYLAVDIADQLRTKGAQAGLIEALYKRGQLKLEYDAATTRNAAQAFAARSGNCLSLVIMTAALARELKLPVSYQSAYLEETWSRSGSLLFASGHVNITVGRRIMDAGTSRDLSPLTIDFLPPEDIRRMRVRDIAEPTVLAMYANNRAAESLVHGRVDDAYAWTREALRLDPSFMGAYNTLGVVYLRHGDLALAERVFDHVLAHEARNTRALANLAETYERGGRAAEAGVARMRLAAIEPFPPFHFFNLGLEAAKQRDWRKARDFFAREVARADYYHEFHFWLGVADFQLGDVAEARKHLQLAIDNSTTRGEHDLYAAKLAWLQSRQKQSETGRATGG